MICTICRQADLDSGTATVTLERAGTTFIMKGVPAVVCPNCGEEYVSDDVSARVLEEAEEAFQAGVTLDVRHFAGAA